MNTENTRSNASIGEAMWRRAEKDMARRERRRLIRRGTVTPASFMRPQLMVRNPDVKGGWSPEIKTYV